MKSIGGTRSSFSRHQNRCLVIALTGALKDKNPLVRSRSALSLGMIGTDSAVEALIAELMNPDSCIRPDAVYALGLIGGPRVESYLKVALTDNSDAVRRLAAAALEGRTKPKTVQRRRLSGMRSTASVFVKPNPVTALTTGVCRNLSRH